MVDNVRKVKIKFPVTMIQKDVTGSDNTQWKCVQAFSGLQGKAADKAAEIAETKEGKVTVVCTPSGGAQTVRLELEKDWQNHLNDEQLAKLIEEGR